MVALKIQPYAVLAYSVSNDGGTRQLLVVNSTNLQTNLRNEATRLGGRKNGDWYAMANTDAVLSLVKTAKLMGGYAYDLPFI